MLILARRIEQAIVLEMPDGTIGRILVTGIEDNQRVYLGFDLPGVRVLREELTKPERALANLVREQLS